MVSTELKSPMFYFNVSEFKSSRSQVLSKQCVSKPFGNFKRTYRCISPFLSSCRPRTCNFIKIEGPMQVFCYEFCETLCRTTVNCCSRTLAEVAENKCSRNEKVVIEVTAKALRNRF